MTGFKSYVRTKCINIYKYVTQAFLLEQNKSTLQEIIYMRLIGISCLVYKLLQIVQTLFSSHNIKMSDNTSGMREMFFSVLVVTETDIDFSHTTSLSAFFSSSAYGTGVISLFF